MFLGEYEHSCDSKNRLRIPSKFKKEFSEGAVLTKGNDGCLFLVAKDTFSKILEKTKYGHDGIGGLKTNGLMYVGYPR